MLNASCLIFNSTKTCRLLALDLYEIIVDRARNLIVKYTIDLTVVKIKKYTKKIKNSMAKYLQAKSDKKKTGIVQLILSKVRSILPHPSKVISKTQVPSTTDDARSLLSLPGSFVKAL